MFNIIVNVIPLQDIIDDLRMLWVRQKKKKVL